MPEIGERHHKSHENGGNDELSVTGLSGTLADAQTPSAHKTSHQNGGADEISVAGLAGQLVFVPYNGVHAGVTEDDTDRHLLDLSVVLSESRKIILVFVYAYRDSGSGTFYVYPNEGSERIELLWSYAVAPVIIKDGTQRLQYSLSVANDVFHLSFCGYAVIGE